MSRRRIERSEAAALIAAAFACALGAAAWMTQPSSEQVTAANALTFEDRFVSLSQSFALRPSLQPLDRSALAVLKSKLRDAKGLLAQELQASDWRSSSVADAENKPTSLSEIPLPRSRPAAADIQVAVETTLPPRPDDRSVLQKLSDLLPGKMTLASLAPNSPFQKGPDLASLGYDGQTAVYDITAHAVYLPNGTVLEAHSGMGALKDDPEHVDQRNLGATPPTTYDLKPRERLFHTVRALRMIPVDNNAVLGRAGLLVHSFMLGPDGDSNGCVSIREYDRFRKAFDNGEINRLVVVPSLAGVQSAQRTTSQS